MSKDDDTRKPSESGNAETRDAETRDSDNGERATDREKAASASDQDRASVRPERGERAERGAGDGPPPKRMLRTVYWALWFCFVPFGMACLLVWALTPASGVEHSGVLGWAESWVRDQPVPMGIVTFTLFEVALWAIRHRLPLAYHAYPPLRAGLPNAMRGPFDRARALLEEAEDILERNHDAIVRDVSAKEREKLQADLEGLEETMEREPFDEDAFVDALVKADGEVDVRLGRWRKSEVREYAESIFVAIAVAMALRFFVVEAFKIPSGSMIPTLQVGDHIFVNKFTYGPAIPWTQKRFWSRMPPERGDVIVFAYPEREEQDFIKRVIAIPGDKLEVRGGHPIINGWEVPSCSAGTYSYVESQDTSRHDGELFVEFLEDEAYLTLYDHVSSSPDYQGPFYAKPGEVWVMGDNRNNSHDSRMWWNYQGGGVPYKNIKGRALFVWLSLGDQFDRSRIFAPVMGRPPARGPFGPLPETMRVLEPNIDKCLRNRPPLERTRPPLGGQVVK